MPTTTATTRARRSQQFPVGRRHPAVVDLGCGCRPRPRHLLPAFLRPSSSKPRSPISTLTYSSSSSTTTFSSSSSSDRRGRSPSPAKKQQQAPSQAAAARSGKKRQGHGAAAAAPGKEGGVGVAVVKESSDPYVDFRESMVQMILEMELFEWEELRGLLRRLLALNAPRHHHAILTAFAEIWAELVAPPPPQAAEGYRR